MSASVPPEPESGPPTRPATGRRAPGGNPVVSFGTADDVVPGALLVALPSLTDPTFADGVVYVLDHSGTGTVGVVLGRPSQVGIRDVLPGWCERAVEPEVFHVGGPCETDTALCLAVCTATVGDPVGHPVGEGLRPVADGVHLVDLDGDPHALGDRIGGLRVFAGYAGWSPGQLTGEIARGAWAVVPGRAADVLARESGPALRRRVLARQVGPLAVLSTTPEDPTAN